MGEAFDSFNAPQFVDFSKEQLFNDENADAYFDQDHENVNTMEERQISACESDSSAQHISVPDNGDFHELDLDPLCSSYEEFSASNLRKSMSVGNLILYSEQDYKRDVNDICGQIQKVDVSHSSEEEPKNSTSSNLCNAGLLRTSAPRLNFKSQDHLNKLAQPKRYTSVENVSGGNNGKFVSVAEFINQFQNRTPARFRSKPKLVLNNSSRTLFRTVPQSPMLQTRARNRPLHILSQDEREDIEFKNAQKFKIKACPINKKILQGPVKPTVPIEVKSATIPQPFNLSAPPKKVMPSPKKYEFHARPVPKSAEKPPKMREIEKRENTKPVTPTFMKNYKKEHFRQEAPEVKTSSHKPLQLTRPKPFSFENRDKRLIKKKEDFINKVIQEEKKAREFHANPVPKSVYKKADSVKNDSGSSVGSGSKKTQSQENLCTQFKAKPPIVLYKEPFVPIKPEIPCTEFAPFQLSTEMRAQEREEFERQKREKEERFALIKMIEEEAKFRQEKEEIARMRKEAEYKARPIIKYKELVIQPSYKFTEPISPKFHTDKLRMKNKENIPNNSSF